METRGEEQTEMEHDLQRKREARDQDMKEHKTETRKKGGRGGTHNKCKRKGKNEWNKKMRRMTGQARGGEGKIKSVSLAKTQHRS